MSSVQNINQLPTLKLDAPIYRDDLSIWLRKSPSTIYRWVRDGYLPKPYALGNNHVWPADTIKNWALENGLDDFLKSDNHSVTGVQRHRLK